MFIGIQGMDYTGNECSVVCISYVWEDGILCLAFDADGRSILPTYLQCFYSGNAFIYINIWHCFYLYFAINIYGNAFILYKSIHIWMVDASSNIRHSHR